MKYNQNNLLAHLATSKSRPVLTDVLFTPSCTVATDAHQLIEIKAEQSEGNNTLINTLVDAKIVKTINKYDDMKSIINTRGVTSDDFPDYKGLIPKNKPVSTITLSPKLVKNIADIFSKAQKGVKQPAMTLNFYKDNEAIVITGQTNKKQDVTALIMPIINH